MPNKIIEISQEIKIEPFFQVAKTHAITQQLDDIFYEASGTQAFASDTDRSAFRERWLGSYLSVDSQYCFIAFDVDRRVCGYVVGATCDPASDPRHAALGYFRDFAPMTALYPAHLHVNIALQYRSCGLGTALVEAFIKRVAAEGVPGVHVVTGKGLRNVGFYLRNGFEELAEAPWSSRRVVMLGRRLPAFIAPGSGAR